MADRSLSSERYHRCLACAQVATFIALLSGVMQIAAGLLKIGFLIENILPHSVISGFTSGAAVLIILSQLSSVFRLKFTGSKVLHNMGYQVPC